MTDQLQYHSGMEPPKPLYLSTNVSIAYQLNWSLTLFARQKFVQESIWLEPLKQIVEKDAVRILEYRRIEDETLQFLISTQPGVAPDQVIRSVKGRLQHLTRHVHPRAFHRNYSILSVGEASNECLQQYVAKQPGRHPMADPKIQARVESVQFADSQVNLSRPRFSSHGQYLNNLHLVFENMKRLHDTREESLRAMQGTIRKCCAKKRHLLSRIGLVGNHVHVLLGCGIGESPLNVGLALMNNLAFAFGMKPILDYSFYAGTFGAYDRGAIRRKL